MADVSINTVTKLLVEAGAGCAKYHDEHVRGVRSKRVQCDEIWAFVYAKAKNVTPQIAEKHAGAGDVWTWTAIDADSKLMISFRIGPRAAATAYEFMQDLAGRLMNRVQLTTDGLRVYLAAVEDAFGADIDYSMLQKLYGSSGDPETRYISTSYVERQNLTRAGAGVGVSMARQRRSYRGSTPMKSAALVSIAVSMALLVTARTAAQTATPGDEARKAVQAFYDAYNTHEFDKLTQFTTEDWTHIAPNGVVRRGRAEALQAMKQAHATFLKGVTDTPEDIAVRLATDDVAIVTVRSRTSTFTTPNGVKHENGSRIRTFVVVKRDTRWLIMQDQNTAQS